MTAGRPSCENDGATPSAISLDLAPVKGSPSQGEGPAPQTA